MVKEFEKDACNKYIKYWVRCTILGASEWSMLGDVL